MMGTKSAIPGYPVVIEMCKKSISLLLFHFKATVETTLSFGGNCLQICLHVSPSSKEISVIEH
jgi:hypothetical protein